MDILNFISWIRGGRQVTTVDSTKTLLPVGLKDPKRDDGYLAGAISVADLAAQIGGGGALSVITSYPTTTPAQAGDQFWYQGNLWHYMTQDEIDSTGWTGLVTVGFPAPVSKNFNPYILFDGNLKFATFTGAAYIQYPIINGASVFIYDMLGYGRPDKLEGTVGYTTGPGGEFSVTVKNAQLLTSLKNPTGTSAAFKISFTDNLTAAAINQIFTDLPPTTQVATLDFTSNPGSATCNPTIATSKGYIVVV